jgi:alpha-glucoside transport system ATP-binding protein
MAAWRARTFPRRRRTRACKVNVGVRPEDLLATDGEAAFTGEVEITEALGEVTLLYFKRQGDAAQVMAKLPGIHPGNCAARRSKLTGGSEEGAPVPANGKSLLYRMNA